MNGTITEHTKLGDRVLNGYGEWATVWGETELWWIVVYPSGSQSMARKFAADTVAIVAVTE